jgi:hypothetical protein
MHPMFMKLFPETGVDDLLADEQEKQRAANRARRHRSRLATRSRPGPSNAGNGRSRAPGHRTRRAPGEAGGGLPVCPA